MTISPLMSIGAAAAGFAAVRVARHLSDAATSFVDTLSRGERSTAATTKPDPGDPPALKPQADLERKLVGFQQRVQRLLADTGLTTSLRFQLQSDGQGGIRVVGEHPDRARLEQTINSDPQLRAAFHSISATYALIAAAEQYRLISQQSWTDPISVASDLAQATSPNGQTFTMTINGDDIRVGT